MNREDNFPSLEIIAPTIEEAIAKGLNELNLTEDAVDVEILDRGNKGLFGLGTRQARVRLIVKGAPKGSSTARPVREILSTPTPDIDEEEFFEEEVEEQPVYKPRVSVSTSTALESEFDPERAIKVAQATVADLMERMRVRAVVEARYLAPEEEGQRGSIWIDITGRDLSVLIGRRSQTLHAFQYITSLIVGKELGRSVPLVIDVEGYRSRREAQLRRLATTMAEQVVKTGRKQALEPMPPNERRIIHMELRNFPGVTTESVGEEPHRKVTIVPKR